uniref:Uncharacterized protein LOC114333941 n=1 Tax=Diabrotica virgifera virgifera TaxID=50390 RepID=A0A6P7FTJ0_DIAVI
MYVTGSFRFHFSLPTPMSTLIVVLWVKKRRKELWLKATKRQDLLKKQDLTNYRICEKHFEDKFFCLSPRRKLLYGNALPSIFHKPKDVCSVCTCMCTPEGSPKKVPILSDEIVKTKWKTLRDGYNKYKKHVKQNTASGKISHPYIWSSQLSFLDDMNATTSNNTSSENKPLQCSREATPSLESNDSRDINFVELPSFNLPVEETSLQSFNLPQEEKSPSEVDIAVSTSQVRIESNQPKSKKRPLQGDVDKVIDYLHDRKKKKQDGIDLLFLSYAETFRKLSPRHQVHIKLELAKLFADAELECLEETVDIKPSFTALSSPSHSTISSSNANSSQQQPEQHNPFQDVDQPEYYLPDHC